MIPAPATSQTTPPPPARVPANGARAGRPVTDLNRRLPDNAVIKLADGQYAVDYDYCKGCGLCAAECPCGAIEMEPEQT
jgi:ferredoxin